MSEVEVGGLGDSEEIEGRGVELEDSDLRTCTEDGVEFEAVEVPLSMLNTWNHQDTEKNNYFYSFEWHKNQQKTNLGKGISVFFQFEKKFEEKVSFPTNKISTQTCSVACLVSVNLITKE